MAVDRRGRPREVIVSVKVAYRVGVRPDVAALCALRESVGWERAEADYPRTFDFYATSVAAYDPHRQLVGWCAAVSDGVRHGFLIDLIVAPRLQRHGIGRELVRHAVAALRDRGMTIIHADFAPENRGFFQRCGFASCAAGLLEEARSHAGFTDKQGQYLAFIHHFTKIHRVAPSEAEIQRYFGVSPPAVHQMLASLERRGLIERTAGKPRSSRVLLPWRDLPELD